MNESQNKNLVIPELGLVHLFLEGSYRIDLNRLEHLSGEVSIKEDKMGKDPRKQQ